MTRMSLDYQGMQNIAKNMSKLSEDYTTNIKDVYKIISSLKEGWDGIDNIAFVSKVEDYQEDLLALGQAINNYAKFLDNAAVITSNTQDDIVAGAGRF